MRYVSLAAITVGLALAASATTSPGADVEAGRQQYRQYCGACHGPEARGDGVASSFMRPPPPDLTQLAKQHEGQFPMELVMRSIDGRAMPRAHGDPVMPVWGEVFSKELGDGETHPRGIERRVHERVFAITEYISSVQQK
jgi:mono/diheme cytochrome c family protein